MMVDKDILEVQIQTNQIIFTDLEKNIYKSGFINDPILVKRLQLSGAKYGTQIIVEASWLEVLFFNWVLPVIAFIIGKILSKTLFKKLGNGGTLTQ